MEKRSRERFIRLGTALGVGAATASLAACGGGGNTGGGSGGGKAGGGNSGGGDSGADYGSQNSGGSSQAASGGDAKAGGAAIASESEVAPGTAVKFKEGGQDAILVHLKSGDFVAYSAICTHQRCIVAYKGGKLACPCHGSVFDPANGAEVIAGPAPTPLTEIPVQVEGGEVVRA